MERLRLNGTLQQTAKKYQCHLETIQNVTELLLYGTKAWTFPMQDVNLTLRYPSENEQEDPEHVITGVTVILYMDGFDNGGHIKSGGIMEDNILLTFLLNSTSRLSYQFWLYGVKKTKANLITHSNYQDLC
ncbi:unnamed protein product [Colias eurytheme]|nr:unnamed protein product [Colias eurytheme]